MSKPSNRIPFLVAICGCIVLLGYIYQRNSANFNIQTAASSIAFKLQSRTWNAQQDEVSIQEIFEGPLAQDDPRLLKVIKEKYLISPSTEPYNLKNPQLDPSMGQAAIVKKIFSNKTGGIFVECGGYDGETHSNTLSLEKDFGWKGILIEGGENNFKLLKSKNRKAWMVNACLSVQAYPQQVMFSDAKNVGKISNKGTGKPTQCFPFFSIVSAVGYFEIDYFSLDVEGSELQVLNTIPFESVVIKVLSIEFKHTPGRANGILEFLEPKGYREVTRLLTTKGQPQDLILVHKSVTLTESFPSTVKAYIH